MVARSAAATTTTRKRVVARLEREYRRQVDAYFAGFYRRVKPTVAAVASAAGAPTKADQGLTAQINAMLGSYAWDAETRILSTAVRPVTIATAESAFELAGEELGAAISFDLSARPVSRILASVGTRIQMVTDTSRTRTASMIAEGVQKGLSVEQIVRGVPPGTVNIRGPVPAFRGLAGMVDSWTSTGLPGFRGPGTGASSRSYLIALTETGNTFNLSSLEAYGSSGLVDFVEVFDGQDCGWSSHDSPDTAHGSIRSLEDAGKYPLSHPHCQRAFGARVDVDQASESPYAAARAQGRAVPGATPGIGAVDPLDAEALHLSGLGAPRPTPAIAEAAQRAYERARVAEPGISRALRQVTDGRMVTFEEAMAEAAAAKGGDLAGYAARRKSLSSLSRKIEKEMAEAAADGKPMTAAQAAAKLGDTVRYTVRFAADEYNAGVRKIVDELLAGGNRLADGKWKPKWSDAVDPAYRGINSNWIAPNGTVFEVQFHTPRSFFVKETNHGLYEEARDLLTTAARKAEIERLMNELARTAELPAGSIMTTEEILGTARAAARQSFSYLDDAEVVAARARLAELRATYQANPRTPGINDALVRAEQQQDAAIRAARARIDDRIRTLATEEARAALRTIDDDLVKLQGEISAYDPAMLGRRLTAEEARRASELATRREALARARTEISSRLPLDERILARPTTSFGGFQEVYDEALRVGRILEEELGRGTRWTGRVTVGESERVGTAGLFGWDGHLDLAKAYAAAVRGEATRFKVILHEMWHSMSRVSDPAGYSGMIGFEEGIVERLTQLSWSRIRDRLGKPIESFPYRSYETFTRALVRLEDELEDLGAFAGGAKDVEAFYIDLLRESSGTSRLAAFRDMVDAWAPSTRRGDKARELLAELERALSVSGG